MIFIFEEIWNSEGGKKWKYLERQEKPDNRWITEDGMQRGCKYIQNKNKFTLKQIHTFLNCCYVCHMKE